MKGLPTYGWARLNNKGLIDWTTFTQQQPSNTSGWVRTFKIRCQCTGYTCDEEIYSEEDNFMSFEYTIEDGVQTTEILFYYDTYPVKFIVLKGGVEIFNSGFIGLPNYQPMLDQFLIDNSMPPETLSPVPITTFSLATQVETEIEIQVISVNPKNSQHYFKIKC